MIFFRTKTEKNSWDEQMLRELIANRNTPQEMLKDIFFQSESKW